MALNEAEIRRKASLGIPLTNPTPESQALYDDFKKSLWEAEVKRKAAAGQPLTNPTPEAQSLYQQYQQKAQNFANPTTTTTPTPTATQPSTPQQPMTYNQPVSVGQPRFQNQYLEDAQKLITQLQQITSQPFTFTQQDLENNPTYQAATRLAEEGAKAASKRTMEAMNDRNILNSSITASQLGQIEQQAALKPLELVPQIQQQAYQQYQSGIQNQAALAQMLLNAGFDERNFQSMLPMQEAALTGQYIPGDVRGLIDTILNLKQQAEAGVSPEQLANYRSQADAARQQLYKYGIDADALFGSDVPLEQAARNAAGVGRLTTDAQTALLNTILGLGQSYGALPQGTGNIVGGLPMYSGLSEILANLEGQPTLGKQAQDFNQKMAQLDFSFKTEDAAQQRAIQWANHNLSRIKAAQDIDYQNWLKSQKISENQAKQATQGYITQILNEPDRDSAMQYIVENAASIMEDGANVTDILNALNSKYPTPNDLYSPNNSSSSAVDPLTKAAVDILKDDPRFNLMTPEGQALLEQMKAILAGKPVQ